MKLEEIRMNMEVKVIRIESTTAEKKFIGETGKVVNIFSDLPYPIEVDFGSEESGLFLPEELEKV